MNMNTFFSRPLVWIAIVLFALFVWPFHLGENIAASYDAAVVSAPTVATKAPSSTSPTVKPTAKSATEPTAVSTVSTASTPAVACGLTEEWISSTLDTLSGEDSPFSMLTAADTQFQKNWYQCGGAWGPGGVTLPKNVLFWTDFGDEWQMPAGIERVKTRGNWGLFRTTDKITIKVDETAGGRWASISK
jgi:hypothetical protein